MPSADEKKSSLIHRVMTCTLGRLTPDRFRKWCAVQHGSERLFGSVCGRIRISLARSAAFWTFCVPFSTSLENIADAADLSQLIDQLQTRATSVWQGIISGCSQWVKRTHVQALLLSVGLAKIARGYDCERLVLASDNSKELFPMLRTPTGLIVQVKNKTQNWAIYGHWHFLQQSVWSGTNSFSWKWWGWLVWRK